MGTRLDLVITGVDNLKADHLAAVITGRLDELEQVLSIHRPDSELSVLNIEAAIRPVAVSDHLMNIILKCVEYYKLTNGIFDISRTRLSRLRKEGNSTDQSIIKKLVDSTGMDKVIIDKEKSVVSFESEEIELDSGGFGKGIALEEIRRILKSEGVNNSLISFGESSIAGIGTHPHGPYWPIAVSDIFNINNPVKVVELVDSTMSTSGTGFRDGKGLFRSSGNIIHPFTGEPVGDPRTVTVVCDDPFSAEVLSTALLIDNNCLVDDIQTKIEFEAFEVIYNVDKQVRVVELFLKQ